MTQLDGDGRSRDDELSAAEQTLPRAATTGTVVDLSATEDDRTVRAELLVELLTGQQATQHGRPRAVKLRGARITGRVDLEGLELMCPLLLAGCDIDEPVNLSGASASAIRLPGSRVPGLNCEQLRTTGNVELTGGTVTGELQLAGAHIGGRLRLDGTRLTNPGRQALSGQALTVEQGMWCRDDFTADGEVNLSAARINGPVMFNTARLRNPGGRALTGDGLVVTQNVTFRDGFTAEGEVRLPSAQIARLSFRGARLSNPGGYALQADGLIVEQHLDCRDGFSAEGEVHLLGARIGGSVYLNAATLSNPGGTALKADRMTVAQDLFAEHGFAADGLFSLAGAHVRGLVGVSGARISNPGGRALYAYHLTVDQSVFGADGLVVDGETNLANAQIGGQLNLCGARLDNPGGSAVHAGSLSVADDVLCQDGFVAEGTVHLAGASVDGVLSFAGATLTSTGGFALYGSRLSVRGGVHCRSGFRADGEVLLAGAQIGGYLDLSDATLTTPRRQALDLEGITALALILLPRHRPDGAVNLTNARVGIFVDDPGTWPVELGLRGFTYDSLDTDSADVSTRLGWLTRARGGFAPQLYDQLAAAYLRAGDEQAARKVAIVKQWRRRGVQNVAGKLTNWLLYLTVGYGYRTWQAAIWLAGLIAIGTTVFSHADMIRATTTAPAFNALAYTVDTLLPIGDLGQQQAWQPHGAATYWSWALIAAGWILTTAVAAALTGLTRKTRS